jgi:hypothetical protein
MKFTTFALVSIGLLFGVGVEGKVLPKDFTVSKIGLR